MRRDPGVDDAGDPGNAPGRLGGLRGRAARCRAQWRGSVLRARASARWSRSGAAVPARSDRPGVEREDQSRKSVRLDGCHRPGGGGLSRDGRAPRDQDAAAALTSTALITGASRGIGREVARALASEGWHVLSGVRDANSAPPGTQAEVVDMGKPESIEALAERFRARNQRLDALVNNAGVYRGPAREIWDVNVLGPLLLTRALEPFLARNARVVMVTSSLGQLSAQPEGLVKRLSNPHLSLAEIERLAKEAPDGYGASKAALTAMARLFAEELRPRGDSRKRHKSGMGAD